MVTYTHYNGARDYGVIYNKKESTVQIYKLREDFDYYPEVNGNIKFKKPTFKDYHLFLEFGGVKKVWLSSSVLIELPSNKYVFVGGQVYSFSTKSPVEYFESRIGNSDVPYPAAMTSKNVYFFLDQVYVPVDKFPSKKDLGELDLYDFFYGNVPKQGYSKPMKGEKMKNLKIYTSLP